MKLIICAIAILLLLPVHLSQGEEDPRFTSGNLGIENSYLKGVSDLILKCFNREGWSLRGLESVRKVGGVYVVTGFITLDEIKEPVAEKDFERINKSFEPFIQAQIDLYKKKGIPISSIQNDFPLPSSAKGYTKNELPRMAYVLSGEKDDLFCMDITFSERKEDHLVINFTIVAVP
jgi:hypothetical protein